MIKRTLLLACAAFLLLAGRAQAQSVTVEGIRYTMNADGRTAFVTGADENITTANVLATVNIEGMDYPVTAIGSRAFADCYGLQSVTFPEGLQTIGGSAFFGCDALQSIALPQGLQSIGRNAFAHCYALQSVTLPQELQSIGEWAFQCCTALRSVIFPQGLQTIGSKAFMDCTALRSVTLPEGLQTIDSEAFHNCNALRDIISHAATPSAIDRSTFDKDTYLIATLTVPEGAEDVYRAAEYWGWFWNATISGITYGLHGGGQSAIVSYADPDITAANVAATVNIGGADYPVTAIGEWAFSYCDALQSIALSEGLQSIGEYAFNGCDALESIDIPQGVTTIGSYAFQNCTALQSIDIPQSVTEIGGSAFHSTALQSVTLPEGLQSIGNWAFKGCTALQSIICHAATPPAIEEETFERETYATATLHVPEGAEDAYRAATGWSWFYTTALHEGILYKVSDDGQTAAVLDADESITAANILAIVDIESTSYPATAIGNAAFSGCIALQSIDIPQSVTEIGDYAFSGCTALQSIISHAATPPTIYESTFNKNTYATTSLTVPQGAEAAYRAAECWRWFYHATIGGITYVRHDDGQSAIVFYADPVITAANILATVDIEGTSYPVTAIGEYAFQSCNALQSVTLPEGLQTIGSAAFSYCNALQSITFPKGLQSIGMYAFQGCSNLQSITIPESVDSISTRAFEDCPLQSIICLGEKPARMGDGVFYIFDLDNYSMDPNSYATEKLHVPQGAEAAYYAAKEWRYFAPKAEVNSVVYALNPYSHAATVYRWPKEATSATIPSAIPYEGDTYTVDAVGIAAFQRCYNLQAVSIPQSVTHIGGYAFQWCTALQSINIPEGVVEICLYGFLNCYALQSITLPSTLQRISEGAFMGLYVAEDVYCHATIPPTIYEGVGDLFDENIYETAILHVPSNAVSSYQAAQYWEQFIHIEGDLPSIAISSVATDASPATYANGTLTLSDTGDITVYAQSGAQVRHAADATSLSLEGLPRGIYIISIEIDGQRQVMKAIR